MLRALLYAGVGALPAVLFFVLVDPYNVVGKTDSFYPDYTADNARTGMNKGVVTVRNYEGRTAEGHSYNAFIFGSSISIYYDAAEWAALLSVDADSDAVISPYHFDSSGESIEQMAEKLTYLARRKAPLDYALIVLDPIVMASDTREDIMFISPPEFNTSLSNRYNFYYTFLRASTNVGFLRNWIPGKLHNFPYEINRTRIFEPQPIGYDPVFNQESLSLWDCEIRRDYAAFYAAHPLIPWPASPTESEAVLTPSRVEALGVIAGILHDAGTDYRVIVGPNRRRVFLNSRDLEVLRSTFEPERVYDFSRSLDGALECDTLLYDPTHYRPPFASRLMRSVYSPDFH